MRDFTDDEKSILCERLAAELPRIRRMMHITQTDLGKMCGYSRIRISNIETGREEMSWHQFMAIIAICLMNEDIKAYAEKREVITKEFTDFIER